MTTLARSIAHQVKPYGHCASICPHKNGILLAYYNGPECSDEQAVNVEYCEGNKKLAHLTFPVKTGNCVLCASHNDKAVLIFSYFNDTDGVEHATRPVKRWRFCSNWRTLIEYKNQINCTRMEIFPTDPMIGYLVRCNPIKIKDSWFLPIYREHDCHGVILKSNNGWDWHVVGRIGVERPDVGIHGNGVLIQPTIWFDGKIMHSLSRNITPQPRAWYSKSEDIGKHWTEPIQVSVWNQNNSIVAIHNGTDSPWLVWNHGSARRALVLGRWKPERNHAVPYLKLNDELDHSSASYPNYCFDKDGNLQIVHTDTGVILRHIIQPKLLQVIETMATPSDEPLSRDKLLVRSDIPGWEINYSRKY